MSLDRIHRKVLKRLAVLEEITQETAGPVLDELAQSHPGIRLELLASDGSVVYLSAGRVAPYSVGELMERLAGQPYNLFTRQEATILYEMPGTAGSHVLQLSVPGELLQPVQIFAYFNEYSSLPFLVVPLLVIVLLPTLLVIVFAVRLTQRIRGLSQVMGELDLEEPAPIPEDRSRDEIGQLTRRY